MTKPKSHLIENVIAIVFVSLIFAWRVQSRSSTEIAKLDSVNPVDYIQHARAVYQLPYPILFLTVLSKGGQFLCVYELLVLSINWLRRLPVFGNVSTVAFITRQNVISKLIALVPVMLCFAWYTQGYNLNRLAKLDSVTPAEFIHHKRQVYETAYLALCIVTLYMSGLYIGAIEAVAYAVRLCIPKKSAA